MPARTAPHVDPWPREPKPLTLRQERFIDALIQTGKMTDSAIAAGYAPRAAGSAADKLLRKPHIRAVYERRKREYNPHYDATIADVVRELAMIAFVDPLEMFDETGCLRPIHEWNVRLRRSIASIEIVMKNAYAGDGVIDRVLRVKFSPKDRALELLARHLGMLIDRREVGEPGAFANLSDDELAKRIHVASTRLADLTRPKALESSTESSTAAETPQIIEVKR